MAPNGVGNEIRLLSEADLRKVDSSKFNSEKYIFSVGTIEPRKNIEGLIQAFTILKQNSHMQEVKLLVAGAKGWLDSSVGEVWSNSTAKDDIVFLGYVSDLELNALMQRAKIFVLPSFVEGFGIPALEAMTVGTPIVCSNTSSLPEVCGEFAFYCDPLSPQSIADALLDGMTNESRRRTYIDGGLKRSLQFSWNESVKKLENAFEFAVN